MYEQSFPTKSPTLQQALPIEERIWHINKEERNWGAKRPNRIVINHENTKEKERAKSTYHELRHQVKENKEEDIGKRKRLEQNENNRKEERNKNPKNPSVAKPKKQLQHI